MTRKYDSLLDRWKEKPRKASRRKGASHFSASVPIENLLQVANSDSTKSNTEKAKRLLEAFASLNAAKDPHEVSSESSDLIINLIAQHCNYEKENMLSYDSVLALCQGLRNVYLNHGHRSAWNGKAEKGLCGNPLINNEDLKRFRESYRVVLARQGFVKLRARPITAHLVCDISEHFWFGKSIPVKAGDIMLHTILVIGLNLGLRYDEVLKLSYQHVTTTTNTITLTIPAATKISTRERYYEIREWTGSIALRYSIVMDPFVAMLLWLCVRGPYHGYLFCNLKETNGGLFVQHDTAFSVAKFTQLLRSRLCAVGVGEADVKAYSENSLKRGAVQLYRSLGYKDEFIMEIVKSSEFMSYSNYCEVYNDCQESLPRFSSLTALLNYAATVAEEQNVYDDEEMVREISK